MFIEDTARDHGNYLVLGAKLGEELDGVAVISSDELSVSAAFSLRQFDQRNDRQLSEPNIEKTRPITSV